MADFDRHPILRTYRYIKFSFKMELCLYLDNDRCYPHVIAQLRSSAHILHIEKGRYTKPRTLINGRLCPLCNCVEDGLHFNCPQHKPNRQLLYDNIYLKFPESSQLDNEELSFSC